MRYFGWVRNRLRDQDRERHEMCAWFQDLGVSAQIAEQGRPEEKIVNRPLGIIELIGELINLISSSKDSKGIIDLSGGPVSWVNVIRYSGTDATCYKTYYGVRVANQAIPAQVRIESVRRKTFLRKVFDVEWRTRASLGHPGLVADALERLRGDAYIKEAIISTHDVIVTGHPESDCWLISPPGGGLLPTRQAWDCYQAIARHLLSANAA